MAPNDFKGLGEKVSSDKDQSIDDGSRCRPGCWKRSHMSVTVWKRPAAHTRQWRDQVLFFSFFSLLPSGKWRCVKKFNQIDRAAWTRRKRALVPLRTHSSSAQRLTGESNARGLLLSHLGKEMSSLILLRRFSLPFIIFTFFSILFLYTLESAAIRDDETPRISPPRGLYTTKRFSLGDVVVGSRTAFSEKKKK